MPQPALPSGHTPAASRKDKFLLAGVAMVSASAMAVTPVVQNAPVIQQAKTLAYDLTAVMDATASPLEIYGALASNTFTNLTALGSALANNPAPLLSQVLENQVGYAAKFGAAFEAIPTSLKTWYEGANGKARLEQAQAELEAGNISEAYRWFNHSMLYAFQGAFGPLIAPGFILSGIPRGGTEYLTGIPEQIAQNFTKLVAATFTSSVVVSHVFQGAFGTISGPIFELSRVGETLTSSIAAGDVQGAVNAVVNTPGILANAFLNGFDYADADPESGTGGYTEWPGLIRFAYGEAGGPKVVGGLLQSLLVDIPKLLAGAIDNTPEVAEAAPSAVPTSVAAQLVSAVSPKAALTESVVESVKEATPAVESPKVEAPALESAKPVTTKVEAPAVESEKVEAPVANAVPAATDEAAAESATTPAPAKSVNADDAAKPTGKVKVKVTDRIKAKISEAKEAKAAKAKEAKETKAKAKETKVKAKEAKSDKSKGSSDSSGGSGSSSE